MEVNPTIFRAYDIRGKYPGELNESIAERIALAYIRLFPYAKKIVIAYDTRLSSPLLAKALTDVLLLQGKEVIDLGLAPDPLFYFTIFHYGYDGGMMISGSHNPGSYNGITLSVKKPEESFAKDVIEEDIEKIKDSVIRGEKLAPADSAGSLTQLDPVEDYLEYVSKLIHLEKPLKIVVDCANGAMGFLPEKILQKLGCTVKTLYGEFDGTFPNHAPDPYQEENLKDLRKAVLKEKADLGFAYDADGDRVALLDNEGRVVSGDFCLFILAKQALEKKKGPIVHDMRVSKAFLDEMQKEGVKTYFSISHHNAIIDKAFKVGAVFGGEITLHFIFPNDYYPVDDALFSSLKLAEIASAQEELSSFVDTLPHYYASQELFVDTRDEEKFQIIKRLQDYLRENNYDFIDIDGARINFKNGWALARAANTTPIIKCRFEGETKKALEQIEREALELFKNLGIPIEEKHYKELGLRI